MLFSLPAHKLIVSLELGDASIVVKMQLCIGIIYLKIVAVVLNLQTVKHLVGYWKRLGVLQWGLRHYHLFHFIFGHIVCCWWFHAKTFADK